MYSYMAQFTKDYETGEYLSGHLTMCFSNLPAHVDAGWHEWTDQTNVLGRDFGVKVNVIANQATNYKYRFDGVSLSTYDLYYNYIVSSNSMFYASPIPQKLGRSSQWLVNFNNVPTGYEDAFDNAELIIFDFYDNYNLAEDAVKIYESGYNNGYETGYEDGKTDGGQMGNAFDILVSASRGFGELMSFEVFPNVSVGTLCTIPIAVVLIISIFKLLKN